MRNLKIFFLILSFFLTASGYCARLKDIVDIEGVRGNYLIGYGLVVGLKGTGDGVLSKFTVQSVVNMLERFGIKVPKEQIILKNVAAVLVTAYLPPFAMPGQRIDVEVSSLGDAKSLQGGTLLLTPLLGPDGKVYALAQGPISLGGIAAEGVGARIQTAHPTAGKIPNGAIVERPVENGLKPNVLPQGTPEEIERIIKKEEMDFSPRITLSLKEPDFSTAYKVAEAINIYLKGNYAQPKDNRNIELIIPPIYKDKEVKLLAELENIEISPDTPAKVVIDERTGTVVIGENVRISKVAIAHGNISIEVREYPEVYQPYPFSPGETVVVPRTEITAKEKKAKVVILEEGATLGELVRALNAVGATATELISILQAIKAAGALQAELIII
ncbi:MAG: flagellar biosynthesis protein FlgA [Thermodesulfobacterium geofontis]|uniref:Flagellar P-ring protein n=1 Tax=Thermodesulfobacterium geofontis TaxID=1295609 RepID=A0A2N7PQ12_9BACT|nr:MAG: flagellar biosynthesis protein FlgA [Thermodesulfobacterium geofontis]